MKCSRKGRFKDLILLPSITVVFTFIIVIVGIINSNGFLIISAAASTWNNNNLHLSSYIPNLSSEKNQVENIKAVKLNATSDEQQLHGLHNNPSSSFLLSLSRINTIGSNNSENNNNNNKVVILNFYDNDKSQYTNAKPILDKYGFKVTFFIVCNWALSSQEDIHQQITSYPRMTWQQIEQLHKEGHDIESHSMNHKRLDQLPANQLDFEVGQSKKCLSDHAGVNATVFSPPHSVGWNNATVINTIAKYYQLSIGGFTDGLMYLHCNGWKEYRTQTDCRTYYDNGTLTYANRYDIKERTHNAMDNKFLHNGTKILENFIELVNLQTKFNKNSNIDGGKKTATTTTINAIPIIGYHNIDISSNNNTIPDTTDVGLFAEEMKYLHDNHFKVLTMSDLGYDDNSKYLYIKSIQIDR